VTAAQARKAARQLVDAAAAAGEQVEPKYRIETRAGLVWDTYASAADPARVAELAAEARRTGYRYRIVDRHGAVVHVHHDAAGRAQLVTIPD
jgi:hypothetical protein